MKKSVLLAVLTAAGLLLSSGCATAAEPFTILSASENKEIAPVIEQFTKESGIPVNMEYKGSLDIMQALQKPDGGFDAVWPANSMWITMGDSTRAVKLQKSIMTSPVVFGVKKSVAQELGFTDRDVSVGDILSAIRDKRLTFTMTSATQSNSGASAYFGFLYALLGNPDVITSEDLESPGLKDEITELLSGVERSSGSSEWLKELFLEGDYDAMVNYESVVISANKELLAQGREPLYAIYPYDGLSIADSPLGYVDRGDPDKEAQFNQLQDYLLSADVQKELLSYGRRTGLGGTVENADPAVFNPDWGIDAGRVLSPIKMPSSDVILQALSMYQTEFKKPSYTVYCLDFSGSMSGEGETQLKEAMKLLLDQQTAAANLLQAGPQDVTAVIPFSDKLMDGWTITGDSQQELTQLYEQIARLDAKGGTDIYSPAIEGINQLASADLSAYSPAVILMTDGESNTGRSFEDFKQAWENAGLDIPVFAITFGNADDDQLSEIAGLTRATVFDGRTDLVGAFKKAKGYN